MRMPALILTAALSLGPAAAAGAVEEAATSAAEAAQVSADFGPVELTGTGDITEETQGLEIEARRRGLFGSPAFLSAAGRVGQEKFIHYDMDRWGGSLGLGWALGPQTELIGAYRWDRSSVRAVSPTTDPDIRSVSGLSDVTALVLTFRHDTTNWPHFPTAGRSLRLLGELSAEALGGDYNFARLDFEFAGYLSPFNPEEKEGGWWRKVTLVEHFRVGYAQDLGSTDEVPFFERYFAGGASTVRGHRNRWLSPRGDGEVFVGGELLLLNNIEARLPLFEEALGPRRLSAAVFFDAGRSFRHLSDVGDFGYGLGAGLRYGVRLWKVNGVLRLDVGFNPAPEGDDTSAAWHLTFGTPF